MAKKVVIQTEEIELIGSDEIIPDKHVISDGDIENYPELTEQGVKSGDGVEYDSLYVNKSLTADGQSVTQIPWPINVSAKAIN